jgi:omega-amidase
MKENLNIALVQSILHWEDITANLAMFKDKLAHLKGNADIIVLPEMFSTGFSMEPAKLAEKMNGRSLTWMLEQAKILNSVITGSLIIHENNSY